MNKQLLEQAIKTIGNLVNQAHNTDCEEKDSAVADGWKLLEQLIAHEGTGKFDHLIKD
ncbi:hypothetical protein [Peribacillus asahii]|uniref:hypothetical protein n=1 Tax=Peribacillus asahii TaxID=228899 RepID=UPI0038119A2E